MQHVAAGSDLNDKEPTGRNTSLIVAAVFGQTEAARLLIEKGWQLCAESICLH